MQTRFTPEQLTDPAIREANDILRACVHCGFCTATCPTYVELGDERDSPRGRIYLIKEMLESGGTPGPAVVTHVDRCLSCLSCMTTCPSGVDYMHLVDLARARVAETVRRPWPQRWLRGLVARLIPNPRLFRLAIVAGGLARPILARLPGPLGAMGGLLPKRLPPPAASDRPHVAPADGPRRLRIGLLPGCAQQVLRPAINAAAIRVLRRLGCEVVVLGEVACCGALVHHMGREAAAHAAARALIAAVERADEGGRLDGVVTTASGCGVQVKDLGHLLALDSAWAGRAADVAARARDVSEVIAGLERPRVAGGDRSGAQAPGGPLALRVAYHSACSLRHGQKIGDVPHRLLKEAGFAVSEPVESHICCGSAGTYNILQPELAGRLRRRKARHLAALGCDVVATGNIGCLHHLGPVLERPVVHAVELLDWAWGGPKPAELAEGG